MGYAERICGEEQFQHEQSETSALKLRGGNRAAIEKGSYIRRGGRLRAGQERGNG